MLPMALPWCFLKASGMAESSGPGGALACWVVQLVVHLKVLRSGNVDV